MKSIQSIKMDNLFYSMKELQNEKVGLERKLHEVKRNRHTFEQEFEQESSKCSHIQDRHMRMSETYAVAQQKVEQGMKDIVNLQSDIDRNRPKLNDSQAQIDSEQETQSTSVNDFQDKLSTIASILFQAKNFYRKNLMTSEIQTAETTAIDIDRNGEGIALKVQDLSYQFEKLLGNQCVNEQHQKEKECLKVMYCLITESKVEEEELQGELPEDVNEQNRSYS